MGSGEKSLRLLIEKWLELTHVSPARVTRFSRMPSGARYVCVGALRPSGPLAIFFFRHDDGSWCVFPPEAGWPATKAQA
ncbi:hypothetical protein PTE30175_05586 [Pandoraea terrae]|uniref:Uncharacterized protein n=1 Tax=Pandoraea terrae TaxID=1537710 RepID=A0A5E4ZF15_9BURK|nr:hypothetical protein [Pandoraea terrae]VVE59674.1 hypothetical protein PTE30175_05586 [Pandoraea terrae]